MLTAECFKQRLEKGLSILEFNYMLMQSYDFYRLFCDYGCVLELGGDDQWSNILGGVELIRRKTGKEVYGMTFKLLTNSEGKKMGKTEKGAVWLDPEKTPPYDFFQYWRNLPDADIINCLKMLTFLPMEKINEYATYEGSRINEVKEVLAYEVTKLIHGEEEATKALETARQVFVNGGVSGDMPTTALEESSFSDGKITVIDMLVTSKLAPSKGEARRLIQQGGIMLNDNKVGAFDASVNVTDFATSDIIIKKGKKVYHRFILA